MRTYTLSHNYAAPMEALWADLLSYGALTSSLDVDDRFADLPSGAAQEGDEFTRRVKHWSALPGGKLVMRVLERDDSAHMLRTQEHGGLLKLLEHRIELQDLGGGICRCTDTLNVNKTMLSRFFAAKFPRLYTRRHDARTRQLRDPAIVLRQPRRGELAEMSALCLHSKAVWGYDDTMLVQMADELTLTLKDLREDNTQVALINGEIVGVAHVSVDGALGHLEKLFVSPDVLKAGIGRALYAWSMNAAGRAGARELVIESDPNAVEFYTRFGPRAEGEARSASIAGRMLPRFVQTL